jgi:phosphonate transport system substrate-binding protein
MNTHSSKQSFFVLSTIISFTLLAVLLGAVSFAAEKKVETLVMGVVPHEEIQLTAVKFKGVVRALEEVTGRKVEWYFPTSYASLVEAQRRGFVHLTYLGPRTYVDAHRVSNGMIEAIAQATWGGGPYRKKEAGYRSLLIVKADSPYKTVKDLKGKLLALGSPASTSGDLTPKVQLGKKLGMKLTDFFGKTIHAGSHDAVALAVVEGRADTGALADIGADWAVDNHKEITPESFRILWKSDLLPLDPFALRKDVPSDLRESIKKALLHLNETDYGKKFLKAIRADSIIVTDDSAYDTFRELYAEIGKWE